MAASPVRRNRRPPSGLARPPGGGYSAPVAERLVPIKVPPPDAVDPLPIVLAKDGAVVVSWVSWIARKDVCIIMSFPHALLHRYGDPVEGHRLKAAGLEPFGVYEVEDSGWLRELGAADKDAHARSWKHFVLSFKKTVFECVARDYGCEQVADDDDTVRVMSKRLYK